MNNLHSLPDNVYQLLEQVPFSICILGKDFTITDANKLWLKMLSVKKEDIIGKRLSMIFPQIKKNLPDLLTEIATTDKPFHIHEFPLVIEKDGQSFTQIYNCNILRQRL